jgi:hypothetical protein
MASLKYSANSSLQTVTLGSNYTAASGTMTLTAGHGARLPATGDYWIAYNNGAGTIRIFKVTARSTDTLTVVADATEGSGDGNISSGETLRWALTVSALTQLRADIVAQGAFVLLKSLTASASATLDFATRTDGTNLIQSDFDDYMIRVINVMPATDGAQLTLRVSTDNGASYISTASYQWIRWFHSGTGSTQTGDAAGTAISLSYNIENTGSQYTCSGVYNVPNPAGGAAYFNVFGDSVSLDTSGTGIANMANTKAWGAYKATTAVNALQFLMSSGNIASGTIRIYGIAKS